MLGMVTGVIGFLVMVWIMRKRVRREAEEFIGKAEELRGKEGKAEGGET